MPHDGGRPGRRERPVRGIPLLQGAAQRRVVGVSLHPHGPVRVGALELAGEAPKAFGSGGAEAVGGGRKQGVGRNHRDGDASVPEHAQLVGELREAVLQGAEVAVVLPGFDVVPKPKGVTQPPVLVPEARILGAERVERGLVAAAAGGGLDGGTPDPGKQERGKQKKNGSSHPEKSARHRAREPMGRPPSSGDVPTREGPRPRRIRAWPEERPIPRGRRSRGAAGSAPLPCRATGRAGPRR